jgi:hypothetical protein
MDKRSTYNENQIISNLVNQAKSSSKKRGKRCPFDITCKDIENLIKLQNNRCIYTDREFVYAFNEQNKPSIDRIDSNKGYTKDNIQMVITPVNIAKSDMSHDKFLDLVKDIYKNCN